MSWAIVYGVKRYREADLTLHMASQACKVAGVPWTQLHPLKSPDAFCGLLAAFLEADGMNLGEAVVEVAGMNMVEALSLVEPD